MTALRQPQNDGSRAIGANRDRRRHRRLDLKIPGRYMSEASEDYEFETVNISCSGAYVSSRSRPETGSPIVCYFDGIGRVTGQVVRSTAEGFAVYFSISLFKRDKLADRLTWLWNKDPLGLTEERNEARYSAGGPALVQRQDGRNIQCVVTDISLSGAGFETSGPPPLLGEIIKVGSLKGEVVRRTEKSFGVRFLHTLR